MQKLKEHAIASLQRLMPLPTGPSESPAEQQERYQSDPFGYLGSCRERFGDVFTARHEQPTAPRVFISNPDDVQAVFGEPANPMAASAKAALGAYGDRSVVLLEGDEHLQRRRLMLPAFHGEKLTFHELTIAEIANREVDSWPLKQPLALLPRMRALTLQVILRSIFGVSDPDVLSLIVEPIGRGAGLTELREVIDSWMLGEIDARRSDPQLAERGDVLSMLILARFDDGSEIDDAEICDQLFTLLNASYETTATALAWTIDLLLHNRPALERLLDELEDGESDEYLRCVVKESLRLRPVLMLTGRELAADLETETLSLPAGTIVSAAIGLINTRPDLYPEPFAFKPERFLENPPTTYGWLPYGGGTRRCLGAAFAELQIRVVLRSIFSLRTLAAESDEMEAPRMRGITLTPPNGVRVIASPRDNHAVLK